MEKSPPSDPIVAEPVGPEPPVDVNQDELAKSPEVEEEAGASGGGGWGGWANGWMDTGAATSLFGKVSASVSAAVEVAKTKSSEAYGLVSKDLEEVSSQAISVVGSTASNIKRTLEPSDSYWYYYDTEFPLCGIIPYSDNESEPDEEEEIDEKTDVLTDKAVDGVKKSVSSFFRYAAGYAQQMFNEEDLESEAILVRSDGETPVPLDRLQAQLLALASDPDTFLTDPDPEDDLEKDWKSWSCDLEKMQGEISDLMVNNQHVRKNYSALVPEKVTHKLFWTRYFFKVHLIDIQERRRQALKARAERQVTEKNDLLDAWDDEDDKQDIPSEVQERLLSDYERELIASKLKKTLNESDLGNLKIRDKGDMVVVGSDKPSPIEKDENSSDDWERLSAGEKSPRKSSKGSS